VILRPLYRGPDLPTTLAVDMNAAAPTGITVAHSTTYDLGSTSFSLPFWCLLDDSTPASEQWIYYKYQDASNYWGLRVNTDGTLQFIAVVGGVTILSLTSTVAIPTGVIFGAVSVTRESALVAGSAVFVVSSAQLGTSVAITAGAPASVSNTGTLYVAGTDAAGSDMAIRAAYPYNRALSLAEVAALEKSGVAAVDVGGTQTPVYASDFSAGIDSWSATSTSIVGNIDAIDGVDDCLRITIASTGTGRRINRTITQVNSGDQILVTGRVYFPVANVGWDSFTLTNSSAVAFLSPATFLTNQTKGVWINFSFTGTCVGVMTGLRIYAGTSAPSTSSSVTLNDIMYLKDLVIKRIGNTLNLDPTGIAAADLTWTDSSGNANNATLPASGATKVTLRK
jgi:hypothetical protein